MDLNDITQEEFEKIEAYLNGLLSDDDIVVFENRLENEDGFASKVSDIKTVLEGLENQALKEQLDVFHTEMSTQKVEVSIHKPKTRSLNWKRIAVAAVLVIGLGSFWLMNGNSNERLYAKYFSPDPGLPTTMSTNSNYEFYEAMVSYKQDDYKTAISKWEILQESKPKNDTLNYFIGSALMADKKVNEALPFLISVTKQNEATFKSEAYYYIGLAHLKNDDLEAAKNALNQSDLPQSKDLLKKLN